MIAAVGRVQVDHDVRIPRAQKVQRGSRLGRFGFDVVAIEIKPLRVGALADDGRAVLLRPILFLRAHRFVAIDVVDRSGHDDE